MSLRPAGQAPVWRRLITIWLPVCLLLAPLTSVMAQEGQQEDDLPVAEIQAFAEIFERIKRAYVEEVDDATLLQNAMRGMLSELDPHSAYLDSEAYESLRESTQGEFGGVGIEVGKRDGQLTVITPIDDTPAFEAGLQAQDSILRIDDTPTEGLSLQEAVDLMRGEPGTQVRLTIMRSGEDGPRNITLEREIIRTQSVKHDMLSPGYGYLRISQFQTRTADQVVNALNELTEEQALQGLVLDLRNNPGGVLQAAVDVADAFMREGRIVYTEGRLPDSELSFSAHSQTVAPEVPLVILINGGSASAAEIVAGALQDQRRGVVMGTQSFGKGSVQQIMPLGENEALKLTTARYYTPDGRSIQAQGIEPDVRVVRGRLEVAQDNGLQVREADLDGHLAGNGDDDADSRLNARLRDDYQLGEALNLLKALNVLEERKR
ncbi:S41 family peptidase [Halomonas sp. 18H]|uniref:S41 family peptidase n=1 Tax=Halomonas almeriensis TaxID=308163 RepID=UPI002230FFDE|nr:MULTISPECIES: S41 family peptidase [Halomonas]MCW4152032.1 S41 family peptidase [Halomonas sp. 18H]MDN3552468.1 S41 family peptidase [Halomonas almeriensis]